MKHGNIPRIILVGVALTLALVLGAFSVALAGCPDGGGGDDAIDCDSAPDTPPDVDGGGGADVINVTGNVGANDVNGGDSCSASGGTCSVNDGDDTITVDGTVGGDVNGDGECSVTNGSCSVFGGDDTITVDGTVGGGVNGNGECSATDGACSVFEGDDKITINGTVSGDVRGGGECTVTNGACSDFDGQDTITVSGTVGGDVLGDGECSVSGGACSAFGDDDTVILQGDASVGGIVDGGPHDTGDTIVFEINVTIGEDEEASYIESLLAMGGEGSFGGITWTNFENLIERLHFHIYSGNQLIDCGKDPYLGQRPFNPYCYAFTGDPNELTGADANADTGGMMEQ